MKQIIKMLKEKKNKSNNKKDKYRGNKIHLKI